MKKDFPFIEAHGKHLNKSQTEIDRLIDQAKSDNAPADAYDFDSNRGGWQTMQDLRKSSPGLVERLEREADVTVDEVLTEPAQG